MGAYSISSRFVTVATKIIRSKSRSLAGQPGLTNDDIRDIEHVLMLEVLRRAPAFDPAKGNEGQFLATIVRNAIATLVEKSRTAKSGYGLAFVSLDAEPETPAGSDCSLHDIIDKESYLEATRSGETAEVRRHDLRIDLERAYRRLPEDLQLLLRQLAEQTPSEIARSTGIPRTTINDRVRKLRVRLSESGLGDYLNFLPSDRRRFR